MIEIEEDRTVPTDYCREFADFEGVTYLNAAAQGAMPLAAAREAQPPQNPAN